MLVMHPGRPWLNSELGFESSNKYQKSIIVAIWNRIDCLTSIFPTGDKQEGMNYKYKLAFTLLVAEQPSTRTRRQKGYISGLGLKHYDRDLIFPADLQSLPNIQFWERSRALIIWVPMLSGWDMDIHFMDKLWWPQSFQHGYSLGSPVSTTCVYTSRSDNFHILPSEHVTWVVASAAYLHASLTADVVSPTASSHSSCFRA